jgi:hypothetical protein
VNGKGSKRRPSDIDDDTLSTNWDRIFNKPRVGRTPDILRKSGPMRDKTKYTRKGTKQELDND